VFKHIDVKYKIIFSVKCLTLQVNHFKVATTKPLFSDFNTCDDSPR